MAEGVAVFRPTSLSQVSQRYTSPPSSWGKTRKLTGAAQVEQYNSLAVNAVNAGGGAVEGGGETSSPQSRQTDWPFSCPICVWEHAHDIAFPA